jgi:hypothetical protein
MITNTQKIASLCFALAAMQLAIASSAAAQAKPDPSFAVTGCVPYLQLDRALRDRIFESEESLTRIKAERESAITPSATQAGPAAPPETGQPSDAKVAATPAPRVSPELTKYFDSAIGKLEKQLESRRKLLVSIDSEYRQCIKTPPLKAALAAPAPQAKTPVKRTTSAPREQNMRAASPPRGGHDPGASAIIGGAIGGALGGIR